MIAIGDKVVCIDTNWGSRPDKFILPDGLPIKGKVYCVNGIGVSSRGELFLTLIGLRSFYKSPELEKIDQGFLAYHFRKLDDIKKENELINMCKTGNLIKISNTI
jgi:hypothetical protein